MPDFHVKGDPGAISAKAAQMRKAGSSFLSTADGLQSITADGGDELVEVSTASLGATARGPFRRG